MKDFATASDVDARRLLEAVREHALCMFDPDGSVTLWNEGATRLFGYEPHEVTGENVSLVYSSEDGGAGALRRDLERARTTGSCACEGWRERKDGSRFWADSVLSPVRDASRETVAYALVVRDATQRRESDERLRAAASELSEANRGLRSAEEIAHLGRWRFDLNSNELTWSAEIFEVYGLPADVPPTLDNALSVYEPDDQLRIKSSLRRILFDGIPYENEARIKRADGTFRDVFSRAQIERGSDGSPQAILGIIQDVTERKMKERERERIAARITLATEAAGIGIWDWNIATNELVWDAGMCALYGLATTDLEQPFETWKAALHPADRDRAVGMLHDAIAGGADFDDEFRILRANDEVRHIRARAIVLRADGAATRVVGTNVDVTDLRVAADVVRDEKERLLETVDTLRIARQKAEEANRATSEFLARISREIRMPMNDILGFASILLDGELAGDQRRQLRLVESAGKTLLAIVDDMHDYSRIQAGRIELDETAVNPGTLVDGAVSIVRSAARAKGIALTVNVDRDVPQWVCGDPARLRQILLTLLGNAVKFTDEGSIRVGVSCERRGPAGRLRFEVSDTGVGIPPDAEHSLFQPFSQLERVESGHLGSTGLGLAVSKRFAEAMQGTMSMSRNPARGSTFWFTAALPPLEAPLQETPGARREPPAARRILVAEDNAINQIVVQTMLERDGHYVVLVGDGAQAVAAVNGGDFDLVLMDMDMPIVGGAEATRLIRALGTPWRDVPIVALTANALSEEIRSCREAGMNDHVAKPIDRELLRRAVATWTQTRRPVVTGTGTAPVAPVLELDGLLELFDGSTAAVAELLEAARTSIEADVLRIERGLGAGDAPSVVQAAHKLKGTSGSITARRLSDVGSAIETAAKNDSLAAASPLLGELHAAAAAADAAISEFARAVPASVDGRTP